MISNSSKRAIANHPALALHGDGAYDVHLHATLRVTDGSSPVLRWARETSHIQKAERHGQPDPRDDQAALSDRDNQPPLAGLCRGRTERCWLRCRCSLAQVAEDAT